MKKLFTIGALILLVGCCKQQLPAVVDMPYCDANTTRPSIELTQVARTDSTTELTFMAMYDYSDINFQLGSEISLIAGDFITPMKEIRLPGNATLSDNRIALPQGIPVQFKLIFAPLPQDTESVDFVQKSNGRIINSIWGIDLTGKRSPDEMPAEIPSELLTYDFSADDLPHISTKEGTVKITARMVAWRNWMDPNINFIVNTIDGTQQSISSKFNDSGEVSVDIPLKGTAAILAMTPYTTYANFYADPNEEITLYILPENHSDVQRFIRMNGVIDGKYRNIKAMQQEFTCYQEDADTLLVGKTDTDDYFAGIMKIHSDALDSIQRGNYPPAKAMYVRAAVDRHLMSQTITPDAYTPEDWLQAHYAKPDSVLRFSPEQIAEIRAAIDFTNPLLEVGSIGNPGSRTKFLKAKSLLLAD